MGVDYVQNRSCRVKRELGVKALVGHVKSRNQAALLIERLTRDGQDPMKATITRVVQYPSGPVAEQVTVQELLESGRALDPYVPLCEGCTANFRETAFGCCGCLNYPIARAEEQWLLSRLPESMDSVAGVYLRNVFHQLKIDGEPVATMRRQWGLYFDRGETPTRQWDHAGDVVAVTADQLIQFMFFAGHIGPAHAAFLCLFLGLLPHDIPAAVMQAILKHPATVQDHLVINASALTVLEETQMGMFLLGMMSAAINLEDLLIDA